MRMEKYEDLVLPLNDHISVLLTTGTGKRLRRASMVPTLARRPAVSV